MPSIPVYNTATVQPDALPAVRQSTPTSVRQMADVVGGQAAGTAKGGGRRDVVSAEDASADGVLQRE